MTAVMTLAPVMTAALFTTLLMMVITTVNLYVWNQANLVIPLASPLVYVFLLYLFHTIYGFFVETRGRRDLSELFGQYVPPELVREMGLNPKKFTMDTQSRDMTVMFADIRNFTGIAEGLDPPELSRLMNEYLTPMTRVIQRHRGTIDKYMGDAIMAFWGAPLDDLDHARNALLAAIEMQGALRELMPKFADFSITFQGLTLADETAVLAAIVTE